MYSEDNNEEILSDEFEQIEKREDLLISQWASQVIDFSDCYGGQSSISYSAVNICGRPSKYPAYGDFAESFSLRHYGPSTVEEFSSKDQPELVTFHDFIIVKFEHYVLPKEIKIYETYHPGAIVRLLAYCGASKKWKVLWESQPAPVEKKSREFRPSIRKFNQPINVIRIEINCSLIDYYTGIDGISLTGIKCQIPVERPLAEQAMIKGVIQKKLEALQLKPQKTPSDAIEDFLKNVDLHKFIEKTERKTEVNVVESNVKKVMDVPYEVLFNVMTFLDLKSMFRCAETCKFFRDLIADPLLYIDVNLKFYWWRANSSLLQTLTQRCSLIRKLDLSSCGYFDAIKSIDFITFIHKNGKTLTNLRLNNTQFLNTSCLEAISITCHNLTELSLRNYINVTMDRDFVSLSMLHKLEILDLSRSGISTVQLLNILKNHPNLRRLNVAFSHPTVNMDEVCLMISAFNRNIQTVDMWKSHNLTTMGIRALSECPELEELDFGWCLREEASITESLKMLIQNCKQLKKLILAAIRGLSERDLDNIAKFCTNLEHLDLMGIVGVSSEMCKRILDSCENLRLLDISFCENVDDINILIWRNEYNAVSIKRSEVPNDG